MKLQQYSIDLDGSEESERTEQASRLSRAPQIPPLHAFTHADASLLTGLLSKVMQAAIAVGIRNTVLWKKGTFGWLDRVAWRIHTSNNFFVAMWCDKMTIVLDFWEIWVILQHVILANKNVANLMIFMMVRYNHLLPRPLSPISDRKRKTNRKDQSEVEIFSSGSNEWIQTWPIPPIGVWQKSISRNKMYNIGSIHRQKLTRCFHCCQNIPAKCCKLERTIFLDDSTSLFTWHLFRLLQIFRHFFVA